MSLATRCTACGTIFRVVQDQLKVSDGWVRCGRCESVFNAQGTLFDLERDAPPLWRAPVDAPPESSPGEEAIEQTLDGLSAAADDPVAGVEAVVQTDAIDAVDPVAEAVARPTEDAEPAPSDASPAVPPAPPQDMTQEEAPPEGNAEVSAEVGAEVLPEAQVEEPPEARLARPNEAPVETQAELLTAAVQTEAQTDPSTSTEVEPSPAIPGFIQQAERSERWRRAPMRKVLWSLLVVATLALAVQASLHFRHRLATQFPASKPWLQGLCTIARCRIEALRRIDDVNIESTTLTLVPRAGDVPDAEPDAADGPAPLLRLSVSLRNRGEWVLAMPSVDLSLTNSDGELIARRTLSPLDFGVGDPRLIPQFDTPIAITFAVSGRRVSGYTVEVFYP